MTQTPLIKPSCEQIVSIGSTYNHIKNIVLNSGYESEINWQTSVDFDEIKESDFLSEYSWVALSAGMHEKIIRKIFPRISKCFHYWQSSKLIVDKQNECRSLALEYFNNPRKIDGIIKTAGIIDSVGYDSFKAKILADPIDVLQVLPFIGPTTCYHLAKNIGLPFAKPDRHLIRLANCVGYSDVQLFCNDISEFVKESISVVDIVLWRFATITDSYVEIFQNLVFEKSDT